MSSKQVFGDKNDNFSEVIYRLNLQSLVKSLFDVFFYWIYLAYNLLIYYCCNPNNLLRYDTMRVRTKLVCYAIYVNRVTLC